jgi:regulatory protein
MVLGYFSLSRESEANSAAVAYVLRLLSVFLRGDQSHGMAGTITALVAQKRNRQRVNVYLDGQFAFGLAAIEAAKLHKGQYLSDEEIARLKAVDEIEMAYEQALHLLSFRPRSVEEIRRRLDEEKYSEDIVRAVLERLERAGLLDDEAFARFWVESRAQFGPRSAKALRYEMRQKGVPEAVIRSALDGLDETSAAYEAARGQARRLAQADRQTFYKRLGDFLARRGFAFGIVRETVERLWMERESDSDLHNEEE